MHHDHTQFRTSVSNPSFYSGSLEDFLNFCESKPPTEKYQYESCIHCAIGQWYLSKGSVYQGLSRFEEQANVQPHTFGALAERLRKQGQDHWLFRAQPDICEIA